MKPDWILVANAAHARLFMRDAPGKPLQELEALEHPESRLRTSELRRDHAGHENADQHHGGGVSYALRTDPRRKEHQQFAQQLAQRLAQGVQDRQCKRLTILASSPFLGELRAALDPAVQRVLQDSVDVDLTGCDQFDLERRLAVMAPRQTQ